VTPSRGRTGDALVGSTFGYGARGGTAFIAGRGGNRFGVCLRKRDDGSGPTIVVEGVGANAFQYMTGGRALVLDRCGPNLGAGMTGGVVYMPFEFADSLNREYVAIQDLGEDELAVVRGLLERHFEQTGSRLAARMLASFAETRFGKITTVLRPTALELPALVELR